MTPDNRIPSKEQLPKTVPILEHLNPETRLPCPSKNGLKTETKYGFKIKCSQCSKEVMEDKRLS